MPLPLEGVRILALSQFGAGPFGTMHLADLGAEVIKIERVGEGDFARAYDSYVNGLASHFVWTNRSKESVTLDVKHPDGAAALQRLVLEKADVVVAFDVYDLEQLLTRQNWATRTNEDILPADAKLIAYVGRQLLVSNVVMTRQIA
jgi:crotonobetainyl-CoA:carnitine CoA-transferase CaiB-like acyl-CoA transferase